MTDSLFFRIKFKKINKYFAFKQYKRTDISLYTVFLICRGRTNYLHLFATLKLDHTRPVQ